MARDWLYRPAGKSGSWRSPIALTMLHTIIDEVPDATVAELCWQYSRRVPRGER